MPNSLYAATALPEKVNRRALVLGRMGSMLGKSPEVRDFGLP